MARQRLQRARRTATYRISRLLPHQKRLYAEFQFHQGQDIGRKDATIRRQGDCGGGGVRSFQDGRQKDYQSRRKFFEHGEEYCGVEGGWLKKSEINPHTNIQQSVLCIRQGTDCFS